MKKVLYYPHMNLPNNCEALTTSILFSREIFIVAPERAPIDDRFTKHLISEGAVKRLDPSNFLTEKDFSSIRTRLQRYIDRGPEISEHKISLVKDPYGDNFDEYQIHREKLSPNKQKKVDIIHPSKNDNDDHLIHRHKLMHKGKIGDILELLVERGLATESERGFYKTSSGISNFLLGNISRELAQKNRLTMVTSNFGIPDECGPKDLLSMFLQELSPDLIPTINLEDPIRQISLLIRIRDDYRDELDQYIQNLEIDVNSYSQFALQQYLAAESDERRKILREYVLACKQEIIFKYRREYRELEALLEKASREVIKAKLITAIPICVSIALAQDYPAVSAFMGGFANYMYSPNNDPMSPSLEKHRVIHKIKKEASKRK